MLKGIEAIFENKEKLLEHLKKKSYEKNTEEFMEKHSHYIHEMTDYVDCSEDKEAAAREVGECMVQAVKENFTNKNGKIASRTQADLNFFMIYYVFPCILSMGQETSKLIADGICSVWGKSFKDSNIGYTDYDTLHKSFREKIFGIF